MAFIIAVDGPAGSGKSTTCKQVAKALNLAYIDTGAMYRAVTRLALDLRLTEDNQADALLKVASETPLNIDTMQRVFLGGREVTNEIRLPEVNALVSKISARLPIRELLIQKQRQMGSGGRVIADGRDVGTNVFPQANLKIFLVASAAERATRRHAEQQEKGILHSFEETLRDIEQRDKLDSEREHAPLRKASDALEINTDKLSVAEVVAKIVALAKACGFVLEQSAGSKQ